MKRFLIFLLLIACAPVSENFSTNYNEGVLTYSGIIEKPTPCHTLEFQELVMESFPVQIRININVVEPDEGTFCIQVIEEEEFSREIEIGHEPRNVAIFVNEERVYFIE